MKRFSIIFIILLLTNSIWGQITDRKKSENRKWGFVDKNGAWIVEPIYNWVTWSNSCQYGIIQDDSKRMGIVDSHGKVLLSCFYDDITFYQNNPYFEIKREGKANLYNINEEKEVMPYIYEEVNASSLKDSKYCKVKNGGKYGIYDINEKKEVVPCEYESVSTYDLKDKIYCEVKKDGKFGIYGINEKKEVVPCEYEFISVYELKDYKYCGVKKNGKFGVYGINEKKEIVPCEYEFISVYELKDSKYCEVKKDGKFGVYGINEKMEVFPCEYVDGVQRAGENLWTIKREGKWGLSSNDREILPCIYDNPIIFKNDVASIKKDGEVRLIKNPLKDGSQIQIAQSSADSNKKSPKGPAISRYPAPNSDVDKNIPMSKAENENMFAFIIANENYPDAPVPYALNDGRIFKEYCNKTLGVPEKNINLYEDATFGNIITAVEKMKDIANAYDGEASILFYYAGHGFPDEKQNTAYLLPIDGNATDIVTTGYSLAKFYKDLASLNLKSSVVFLDACFSGAKREDDMLASSRGVAIKVKEEVPQGNMVVFSAAQGDETAHQIEEKGHGLFTYYLLKTLQQANGEVTLGELSESVTKQVKRQSVVINNKKQTPTVIPSQAILNNWQSMKLK